MSNISVFGRISGVCQPYVSRMFALCQPYIRRMSAVCQPYVRRMSAVYPPYVSCGTAVCQPYVRRMSAIPNLPICPAFECWCRNLWFWSTCKAGNNGAAACCTKCSFGRFVNINYKSKNIWFGEILTTVFTETLSRSWAWMIVSTKNLIQDVLVRGSNVR